MDQIRENKKEILETIRRYGEMPINTERSAFLADCWAAYQALCMVSGDAAENDREMDEPLTGEEIMHWVASMENADGTHGAHWTMEQTEQVRVEKEISCSPLRFYAAMNMMYSDYCKAAEKAGCSSVGLYACMAKAFLEDKDAKPDKLARYYHFIAEK